MISIIGLGLGDFEALTLGAVNALKKSEKVFLRTIKHPTVQFFENEKLVFQSYDFAYEKFENIEEVYSFIAEDLIRESKKFNNIAYAVPGHPLMADKSVDILLKLCREEEIDTKILPAASSLDYAFEASKLNSETGFSDLLAIMEILRGENGCPWDKEQTHDSIKRGLIEESYEVLEAIEKRDDDLVVEELGDLLLQIVFHAQIAKEEGRYSINDITKAICNKMITRHPHVFGDKSLNTSEEVLDSWEKNKMKEQNLSSYTDALKHVAKNLPALIRAEKVQKKAAKIGFDFVNIEDAFEKIYEEASEVKSVYKGRNKDKILEEVGDLIFSVANIARILDIDPENALNYTIDKFIRRFEFIETKSKEMQCDLEDMPLEDMDKLWNQSKNM